ncbi:lysine N(6)-hydroxylase/L-ornithine N(5)-oxygenase family protein [Longispora sp. NPDC051575]|uniref:lysine N(6)-hydroxylase/L-ornithine N(5)-oxygenase family protein n=1 Tax=Longispora sp. NPDC051575 TaxID=3154943 RepID=UPI00343A13B2
MPQVTPHDDVPIYDLVGVGFGPSNLALAVAITEHNARSGEAATAVFLERQPQFGWHRGMLLDDATMQVSFLKDLVTLRDPTSQFTFLCYLRDRERLVDFVNHKSLYPLRVEFHDYLEWAAAKVDDLVLYGHDVVSVTPVTDGDTVVYFDVTATGPQGTSVYRARNLVLATGLKPSLPTGVAGSERVWHTSELLHRVGELSADSPYRFVVVGAGQSAAEVTAFLHERFPHAEVCAVFSRYGYSPADDSSFANRIFDPAAVGEFFDAPGDVKRMIDGYHANTNYSVVDGDLIDALYARFYREKVLGTPRLKMYNVSRLTGVAETGTGVTADISLLMSGERVALDADIVVCATGYQPADPLGLLGDAARYCARDELGRPQVSRDYRAVTAPEVEPGVYLQGGTEHTHGITSSLLSNTAVRSGEILQSILDRRARLATRPALTAPALSA